ncbi:acyl-CoA dehydrogenase family protein [Demequina zhanjiangensis]|uniref:Acyl-CoA dehydrogenase family protein n=1 Tax=Demequina zhanjiangensis TaxID=3051659 RepID=A0ABT8G318_9MICO|nr:acyl-CoA dehydrogenase family protein [Demequina sp. SYSU T00b26]MDN4473525.1 acyl-CoA dehydrogenase family protein [Demequina sp. SYSU T00b26]
MTVPSPTAVPAAEQHWVDLVDTITPELAATVAQDDIDARIPIEHLQRLHATGLDAAFLPREQGGEALSYATLVAVVRRLAQAHPSAATLWLMHLGAAHALVTMSNDESAAFFASELKAGSRFANALSEPGGGNLFLTSQTDATPDGDDWSFTGRKMFISGSEVAQHLLLNSRVDGAPGFFGVTIDDTVSFPPIDETSGMRATRSRGVAFAGTTLQRSRMCAPPAPTYANLITVGFAFISIGIAEAALHQLRAGATKAKPGASSTLAQAQWVRMETGMVWAELQAASALAERAAWLADQGDEGWLQAATTSKMLANEVAKKAAALMVRVAGGGGYLTKSPVQRIARDAQAGALMAYSVPFSQEMVGGWFLDEA